MSQYGLGKYAGLNAQSQLDSMRMAQTSEQLISVAPRAAGEAYTRALADLAAFVDANTAAIAVIDIECREDVERSEREVAQRRAEKKADDEAKDKRIAELKALIAHKWFRNKAERAELFALENRSWYEPWDFGVMQYPESASSQIASVRLTLEHGLAVTNISATTLSFPKSRAVELQQMREGRWLDDHPLANRIRKVG